MNKKLLLAGKIFRLNEEQSKKIGTRNGATHIIFDEILIGKPLYTIMYNNGRDGFEKANRFDMGELQNMLNGAIVVENSVVNSIKKGNTMTKLSVLMKTFIDKDLRAMQKLGYLDSSLEITEEGKQWLLVQYFKANKADLGKEAQKELEAKNKSKKCKKSEDCEVEED